MLVSWQGISFLFDTYMIVVQVSNLNIFLPIYLINKLQGETSFSQEKNDPLEQVFPSSEGNDFVLPLSKRKILARGENGQTGLK